MILLNLEGEYIAESNTATGHISNTLPLQDMLNQAYKEGEASGIVTSMNKLYSVVIVPLLTPVPSAWIILGIEINQAFIEDIQTEGHADVSLVTRVNDNWAAHVSTMLENKQAAMTAALNNSAPPRETVFELELDTKPYISFIKQLPSWGTESTYAILQRSREEAMAPYYRLRMLLIGLLVIALFISFFGGGAIANSVAKPVRILAGVARRIQAGDYSKEVHIEQTDELGQLGNAFNDMSRGLYERDKVRNLLGKVISPQIAEELLNKDIQLGGEERELTVLFTDIRNFTSLSEKRQPAEVLEFLNKYLTQMTTIIDKHGGVVDKYIGDAIMALFGAPLEIKDHAACAVACAIEMTETLKQSNEAFKQQGWPELQMGVGINTGIVVAGKH